MPFKHHLAYQDKFESAKYRVTNWPAYNKALVPFGCMLVAAQTRQ